MLSRAESCLCQMWMRAVTRSSGRSQRFAVVKKRKKKIKDHCTLQNAPKMSEKDPSPPPSKWQVWRESATFYVLKLGFACQVLHRKLQIKFPKLLCFG